MNFFNIDYEKIENNNNEIFVIVQYYNDKNKERQREIDECFINNLNNKNIGKIFNFKEPDTIVDEKIKTHTKYVEINYHKRLTFKDAFEYANTELKNRYVAIINADIFFEKIDLTYLQENKEIISCLSRWEYDGKGSSFLDPDLENIMYANCQDGWVFKSPKIINNCDFSLGRLGCDNAIADRIFKSGFIPLNNNHDIVLLHNDNVRNKNISNQADFHKIKEYPEKDGSFLVPSLESFKDTPPEHFFKNLSITQIEFYHFICQMFSKKIKITN